MCRHLTAGQKAMIAEKIANLPHGVRADRSEQALTSVRATSITQEEAAKQLGTPPQAISLACED